jgi:ribonuclease Z
LISPDGSKTIVNCGEGCQRIFLEFGQKISTVNRVCLTHLSHDSIGGMPGMILTTSDVVASAMANAKAAIKTGRPEPPKELPGIDLIGPLGTQQFIHSLRHFMRRDAFEIRVREGDYFQSQNEKPKNQKRKGSTIEESFHVQSIVCRRELSSHTMHAKKRPRTEGLNQVLSFIFTTPRIQGKFLAKKAKELGIPPGPLYGQLKSGKSVTFQNKAGERKTVECSEVVEPSSPGIAIAVLYYPSKNILEQLCASETLNRFKQRSPKEPCLEVIVHMAPHDIFSSSHCISWMASFDKDVRHVFLDTRIPMEEVDTGTPFHAASIGALSRAQLSSEIYGSLSDSLSSRESEESVVIEENGVSHMKARPLLEYIVIPRSKKGFLNHTLFGDNFKKVKNEADEVLQSSGATSLAREILQKEVQIENGSEGELIFTGTGSAMPCKHRNVSGIYLRMENRNAMLLDVGEGTIGQLLRAKPGESSGDVIKSIRAVWISHPHADHHLGILRLLAERNSITSDPLVLIAPPNLLAFLEEYEAVDPSISGSYIFMDCRDITPKSQSSSWAEARLESFRATMERLQTELGITSCTAVPVAHCPHSYAVVFHGTSFGSLAYSGDCRPSMRFANEAHGADLLIHEATFADGMEAEAAVKRHCTVGEALEVSKQMDAKTTVLTHFSQRYPKLPDVAVNGTTSEEESAVIFAFDYMKLTPGNLVAASKLTPALRLLYPETEKSGTACQSSAVAALEVPGLFAQNNLL